MEQVNFEHQFFLLLTELPQKNTVNELISCFVDSANVIQKDIRLAFTEEKPAAEGRIFKVDTSQSFFGYIFCEGTHGKLLEDFFSALGNSVKILAALAENLEQRQGFSRKNKADIRNIWKAQAKLSKEYERLKKAEKVKNERNERWKTVHEINNFVVYDIDLITGSVFLSDRWSELTGFSIEQRPTTLEMLLNTYHPDDIEMVTRKLKNYFSGKTHTYHVEHRLKCKSGYKWVCCRGKAIRNNEGKPIRLIGSKEDINFRKMSEEALRQSYSLLRTTLESTADGIAVADNSGKVMTYNNKLLEMWSLSKDQIESRKEEQLIEQLSKQMKNPEEFLSSIREAGEKPELKIYDYLEFKDGKVFERFSQPQYMDDEIAGRIWSFRDVTGQMKAKNEILKAKESAEASNKAKSEFLANMSHEIRTPLNGIMGITQLLLMSDMSKEYSDNLKVIMKCAKSLLNVINDILDFSKIEAGKMDFEKNAFNVVRIVQDTMTMFRASTNEKGISLDCCISKEIPELLYGDAERIKQVLSNLIGNAVKFTEEGSVLVNVELAERTEENISLDFTVSDTGIGIREENHMCLFKPFSQVDGSSTRKYGGTGLGLAICKKLVENMNGTISFSSRENVGSSFKFTLDFSPDGEPGVNNTMKRHKRFEKSLNMLIVDDDSIGRTILGELLDKLGANTTTVDNGSSAVALILEGHHFDAILMDILMPEMSGVEAMLEIKSLYQGKKPIPIIAVTAFALKEDREKYLSYGFDDYISKPVNLSAVYDVLLEQITKGPRVDFDFQQGKLQYEKVIGVNNGHTDAVEGFRTRLDMLGQLRLSKRFDMVEDMAQKIKISASGLGMEDISRLSFKLEFSARRKDLKEVSEYIDMILDKYNTLTEAEGRE